MSKKISELKIRISPEEKSLLIKKASEKQKSETPNISQHVRYLIKSENKIVSDNTEILLSELQNQIRRVGNNINQITRYFHSGFFSESEKEKLISLMENISENVEKGQEQINNLYEGSFTNGNH
ncbi:uncharacterized protein Yka (UPF0111/DUF47 family) [Lachnospiraceae bacterium PM6-15]|uniref:plasmid mobilization relaxosome protein MobC n=1 Tax=Ohessyouella blattaphilus TaxID=2949333 RepID=UPI003E1F1FE6